MAEVRGKSALFIVVALVGGVIFTNAMLGGAFGIELLTGEEDRVGKANRNLEDTDDRVDPSGGILGPLTILGQVLNILANAPTMLEGLGVPAESASYVAFGAPLMIGLFVLQVVLKQRL